MRNRWKKAMKSLSIRTASLAIAITLSSAAQAQGDIQPGATAPDDAGVDASLTDGSAHAMQPLGFLDEGRMPLIDGEFRLETLSKNVTAKGSAKTSTAFAPGTDFAHGIDLANGNTLVTPRSLDPRYGDIDAFWGDIIAFYGDIGAFWGDINPFYGDIGAFWGDISPFYGDIGAFWGDIGAFYGDIGAFNATHLAALGQFWKVNGSLISETDQVWASYQAESAHFRRYTDIGGRLSELRKNAIAQFGHAGFDNAAANAVYDRHGIAPGDPSALEKVTKQQRAAFFVDWHDTVMGYSGIDHLDHWMSQVNWTPSITQIQGKGADTVIGIVDGSFSSDADLANNVIWSGGGSNTVGGHGAGVASLIAAAHDGKGVMGIAPEVKIVTYNPFDHTGSASWDSVAKGILAVQSAPVGGRRSIINLSLGEPGWVASQGLADVLARPDVAASRLNTVYVVAAGNDGTAQSGNINWNFAHNAVTIFVGSVNPSGVISKFSNQPGKACLLDNGICRSGNELYNRFIVAPGELILVSDGMGGVTRQSGTSFAAPLVSGAIALLHDRWTWLAHHPDETAEIIFRSARDLGAPGVDPVYGHGLLDVRASQSPLNFNHLTFKAYYKSGLLTVVQDLPVRTLLAGGIPSWWETHGVFFTALEKIGDTHRDFAIPMSSLTYGKETNILGHGWERMQDFISERFATWLRSGGKDSNGDGRAGISQVRSIEGETSGQWTMRYDAIQPRFTQDGAVRPTHNAATLTGPGGSFAVTLGHGQGALALSHGQFGIVSDFDEETGGVNPVLGFASGEVFAGATYKPAASTTISVGYTKNRDDWKDYNGPSEIQRSLQFAFGTREAQAATVGIEQKLGKSVSIGAQWTRLDEQDALLGTQTATEALLGQGAKTDAITFSASIDAGKGLSFDLSATGGATETADGQLLANKGKVLSSAAQFSINKRGVVGESDVLRVSVGQPLQIEHGELELLSEQVIDRETGELGMVSQTIGIETRRRYTAEIVYATPITETSEFGLIGRFTSAGNGDEESGLMVGANLGMRF